MIWYFDMKRTFYCKKGGEDMNGVIIPSQTKVKWTTVNEYIKYSELNGVVFVMIDFPKLSGENDTSIGTLPTEYMPANYIYQTCFYRPSNGMLANIFIPNNGNLVAVTNNTSSALLRGIVSYPKKGLL